MGYLTFEPLDWAELRALQEGPDACTGAVVTFMGVVRADRDSRGTVRALCYEAFGEMAESQIGRIVGEVLSRWPGIGVVVRHRVGLVSAGEASLMVGVASAHRDEAYVACRELVEAIKRDVPIWKRVLYEDGTACWAAEAASSSDEPAGARSGCGSG